MISYFCPSCGTLRIGNTTRNKVGGDYWLSCGCGYTMRFYIQSPQTKSTAEMEAEFQQTELTDSQRGTKRHTSQVRKN